MNSNEITIEKSPKKTEQAIVVLNEFDLKSADDPVRSIRIQIVNRKFDEIVPTAKVSPPKSVTSSCLPPLALNQLLTSVGAAAAAVQAGKVMRMIIPANLQAGLGSGASHVVQSTVGQLSNVVNQAGKFAGHVQYAPATGLAAVTSATAVFQVASFITCQHYLDQITKQLSTVQEGIDEIIQRQQSESIGKLRGALDRLEILEKEVNAKGFLTPSNFGLLDSLADEAFNIFRESEANLMAFFQRIGDRKVEELSRNENLNRIKEVRSRVLTDAQLYVVAMRTKARWMRLDLIRSMHDGHPDPLKIEEARQSLNGMASLLEEHKIRFENLFRDEGGLRAIRKKGLLKPFRRLKTEWAEMKAFGEDLDTYFDSLGMRKDRKLSDQVQRPILLEIYKDEQGQLVSRTYDLEQPDSENAKIGME